MMRKVSIVLAFVLLFGVFSVYADETYTVTDTYQSKLQTEQGIDGWYFCAFPDGVKENMEFYSDYRWKRPGGVDGYPAIKAEDMLPGDAVDCGYVFVAQKDGIIRMDGAVTGRDKTTATARIFKNNGEELLWEQELESTNLRKAYNILTRIKEGEEIWFTVDSNGARINDFVIWWPKVEYLDINYVPVSDVDLEYNYKQDFPSSMQQGKDGWYAQYCKGEEYGDYTDMLWNGLLSGYAVNGVSGVAAYMTSEVISSTADTDCAAVWVAPYAGIVTLGSDDGVVSLNAGEGKFRIAKTDRLKNNSETLYEGVASSESTDSAGYSIDVPVAAGDYIYFISTGGGELCWSPKISYTQTALFACNGRVMTDTLFISEGDIVDCIFSDVNKIEYDTAFFLAVYDKDNCLRRLSDFKSITVEEWSPREIELSIDMNFGEESYEGWKISLMALTTENERCFSTNTASTYLD